MTDEQAMGECVGMGSAENEIARLMEENDTLRQRLEKAEADAKPLVDALRLYAENIGCDCEGHMFCNQLIALDKGQLARAALLPYSEKKEA